MEKYYLTGTDEEILLGDVISVDFEKEFNDSLIVRPGKGTATFVRYMW